MNKPYNYPSAKIRWFCFYKTHMFCLAEGLGCSLLEGDTAYFSFKIWTTHTHSSFYVFLAAHSSCFSSG